MEFDIAAADALYNHTRVIKDPTPKGKDTRLTSSVTTVETIRSDTVRGE